jgi:hypothetical protein
MIPAPTELDVRFRDPVTIRGRGVHTVTTT